MAKLEVKHLTISFRTNNGAVRAVRDVSFSLNEGETLAIAGESGSGKSVTTRAIMGILAGNAMVDDGEIIYDGRDLLKIPEEEFHTLRGHRLSMVFQDPLSALNPIMKIGKQLTEAMLLNNKERREDGRRRLEDTLKHLEKAMASSGACTDASAEIKTFRSLTETAVKLDRSYEKTAEGIIEILDSLEEMENAMSRRLLRDVKAAASRVLAAEKNAHCDWLNADSDGSFHKRCNDVASMGKRYKTDDFDALTALITDLRTACNRILDEDKPNFFAVGYAICQGKIVKPGDDISKLPGELDNNFLIRFVREIASALQYSAAESSKNKETAIKVLREELPVFTATRLDEKQCKAAAERAAAAVNAAIDPLELEKDSYAYVFRTSLSTVNRYFASLKQNPKEEKRYQQDKVKYDRTKAKGKFAPSVVPMNLIDGDKAKSNVVRTIETMITRFQEQISTESHVDYDAKAYQLLDYLRQCAQDYAFILSMGMARHRAIGLMKEVGIPEPHRRFDQYPFEFSGGMRQRIVIAIALSANPDILICDEPTTALDVTIQAQILELINRLKRERKLSVIFITHDLGVVANMADRIAIMYAGKVVEYGTADDVFYDPKHPYTWALLSSMPDLETREKLEAIPGTPPDMIIPPVGDAFAARNKYAMEIDFEEQPPMFRVSETHSAATWLLHPDAPKVEPPALVTERIERMKKRREEDLRNGGVQA